MAVLLGEPFFVLCGKDTSMFKKATMGTRVCIIGVRLTVSVFHKFVFYVSSCNSLPAGVGSLALLPLDSCGRFTSFPHISAHSGRDACYMACR